MKGLTVPTNSRMKNYLKTKHFFTKLRSNNLLDKDFKDYQNLRWSGLDEQRALEKNQIKTVPASEWDLYKYLQEIWQNKGMIHVKVYCIGTTTKVLFQPLKQRKKLFSLPSERNWCVKTWMYSSKSGRYLSAQINKWNFLAISWKW